MPIVRSDFSRRGKRNLCLFKFAEPNKKQGADAPQQVDGVRARENIKETAGLVARDVHALRDKLAPGDELASHKKKTKRRSHYPKLTKAGGVRKKEAAARGFKSKTACKENAGVGPQNRRKVD